MSYNTNRIYRNILFWIMLLLFSSGKIYSQAIDEQDSLALVDLYNSTNGPGWVNKTNWLTTSPVDTWFGIKTEAGRVTDLDLPFNRLKGVLPASIGNLSALTALRLGYNELSGSIPESMGNLKKLTIMLLESNLLSGRLPSSFRALPRTVAIILYANQFNYSSFEGILPITARVFPDFQLPFPLIKNGNTLSISLGGTVANNRYTWYKDNQFFASKTGDSTLTTTEPGKYSVSVVNFALGLRLTSTVDISMQDSLALVDFYNQTNGSDWNKNTNWLTTAPASTWHGVNVYTGSGLIGISLRNNNLTGNIPSSIGNITNLIQLGLGDNHLTGSIPSSFKNLSNIVQLFIERNELTGSIPAFLGDLQKLASLSLPGNHLTGEIPSSLGNLANLGRLYINNNQLTGSIPSTFSKLSNLFDFNASHNQLSGPLPGTLVLLPSLTLLRLQHNKITGPLPDSLALSPSLDSLYLHHNEITGPIPESIGKAPRLKTLFLNNNKLSGNIPASLTNKAWRELEIQENNFTFTAMENLPATVESLKYSPQATLTLKRQGNLLSVSAGGTVSNNTYQLFKDDVLVSTQTGDSTFDINETGSYHVNVTNAIATQLILYTDTATVNIVLANVNTTVTENITGTTEVDMNDGTVRLITLTPKAGPDAVNGNVTTTVTIDSDVKKINDRPYVQRHYDISPAVNGANAEATITLYFTQQDFDAFNAYVLANNPTIPLLPINGVDNGNVRIIQFHGTFTGSSDPNNYNNGSILIIPDVSWDNTNKWWEVSFPVSGFSGFFLSTANFALPLKLLEFKGVPEKNTIILSWKTTDEINTNKFIIERSKEGIDYNNIGEVNAASAAGNHRYDFTDRSPLADWNFYRLKMTDKDGKFSYSSTVAVKLSHSISSFYLYPNPASSNSSLVFKTTTPSRYTIIIADLSGKTIERITGVSVPGNNKVEMDLRNYPAGTYLINFLDGNEGRQTIKLIKK